MRNRFTIAGDIGSGKSTIAAKISEIVGVDVTSTGRIQRQIAKKRGMTVLQLNLAADSDPKIDDELDSYQRNLTSGAVVVESRLAWHFVPNSFKIYLYVSTREAARRIVVAERHDEIYDTIDDALEKIVARRASESVRFRSRYGVDINDLINYDVVVDTTYASTPEVLSLILNVNGDRKLCWIDHRNIIPTQSVQQIRDIILPLALVSVDGVADSVEPISAIYVDHAFYIVDGHHRYAAAVKEGLRLIPVSVVATDDEAYIGGLSARQYVTGAVSNSLVYDWEEYLGFRYSERLWDVAQITT